MDQKYPIVSHILKASGASQDYKLRAECLADVHKLMDKLSFSDYKVSNQLFPNVELEFKSDESLDQIKDAIKSIPDSHVMLETVAPMKDYTGSRD